MNRCRFNFLQIALMALVGMGLGACPPVTSKTPIGTTVTAASDPALTGVWKGRVSSSDTASYFTFLPQDDGTITAIVITPPTPQDKGGWGVFALKSVQLGSNHYMNARETIDDGKPASGKMADNVIPILYKVNGDGALVLYIVDEQAAKNAIKSGKLAGTVEEGQFGDVTLTAGPGELDAYMASPAGRALFVKPLVILRRDK